MTLIPGLYIISTPIGNLEDITIRAINTLKAMNYILCEDTRVSRKLLDRYDINNKLLKVYNEYSNQNTRAAIIKDIQNGAKVALISDSGTPTISDPGYKLVRDLKDLGLHTDIVPGVSSVIAALAISTMPTDSFIFIGFLPKTDNRQINSFAKLQALESTIIFFESPNRLLKSLTNALCTLGDRRACVAREITKIYQEVKVDNLSSLVECYSAQQPKGEIVVLISGFGKKH